MALKRVYEYENEGGPMLYKKRRVLKRVKLVEVSETHPKTAQVTEQWFITFCRELRSARLKKHMTQKQLAHYLRTTQAWISDLEAGKNNPTLTSLLNIAKILKINIELIIK